MIRVTHANAVADFGGADAPPFWRQVKKNFRLLYSHFSLQRQTSHLELQISGQMCVMNVFM